MKFDINNLKHWQLVDSGELKGFYVCPIIGSHSVPMNLEEAELERTELNKLGHKVALIQPRGGSNSYVEAMAKLLKEMGRESDLSLLEIKNCINIENIGNVKC